MLQCTATQHNIKKQFTVGDKNGKCFPMLETDHVSTKLIVIQVKAIALVYLKKIEDFAYFCAILLIL
jgi:hypothetical protein